MRIIVHAGMHKTGTSTIQNAYSFSKLNNLGYFPWYGPNHSGLFMLLFEEEEKMPNWHGFRMAGCSLEKLKNLRTEWSEKTRHFLENCNAPTVLLSAEAISGNHRIAVKNLADFCRSNFTETEVILYVRSPLSFMASAFQEIIKLNTVNNFDIQHFWPSYRSKISILDECFGRDNVHLRRFDAHSFHNGDLISDFAKAARIPMPNSEIERANESLSLEAVAALYTQRSLGDGFVLGVDNHVKKNARFVQEISKLGNTRFSFSPSLLDKASLLHPGDLSWVEGRMGEPLLESCCGDVDDSISCEQDLYDLALRMSDKIESLYLERRSDDDLGMDDINPLSRLAMKLNIIRNSCYMDYVA